MLAPDCHAEPRDRSGSPTSTPALASAPAPAPAPAPKTVVVTDRTLFAAFVGTALPVVGRIDPNCPDAGLSATLNGGAQLLVVDGSLRSQSDALDPVFHLASRQAISVLVVGLRRDQTEMATWVERGVGAFVDDNGTIEQLMETARQLALGHTVLGVSVRESLLSELRATRAKSQERFAAFESLTKRERDVLRLLALGVPPEEVARTSFVSLNTVRTQIRGVLAKLDVGSVVGAVSLAYRTGWLHADLAP